MGAGYEDSVFEVAHGLSSPFRSGFDLLATSAKQPAPSRLLSPVSPSSLGLAGWDLGLLLDVWLGS